MSTPQFADRLAAVIDAVGSPVCVGLDPVTESLPAAVRSRHHDPLGAIAEFGRGVLRAITGVAAAVKFQSACYERHGARGVAVLEEHMAEAAAAGFVVVLDAKRGDIGTTSAHYAAAAKRASAHAVTVNAYLGRSGVMPFLEAGLGVFCLVRTSNPDSDAIQGATLADGRSVAEMVADEVASLGGGWISERGLSAVGAVVGATKSADARALRARMPRQILLVPGYGAQGGTADDVRAMVRPANGTGAGRPGDAGVLVTASRSVIYAKPENGQAWEHAVRSAAMAMAREVASVVGRPQA